MESLLKLEIGCGKKPLPGYKTCDIRELPGVDYVCSAGALPFESQTIGEIYSRHVIEHFSFQEFLIVLKEWNRVLCPEGEVYIICPNLLWHLQQIIDGSHASFYCKTSGENHRYWGMGSLFGWQQDEYDVHKFGYYFELLRDILLEFGFDDIKNLTDSGSGRENQPWHLEVSARKKFDAPLPVDSRFYNHFDVNH